ncbi:MAG: Trp family transcriptional regulator [Candidatus Liptonbacteria bacterium]|nr:Trp family transcriptional regulator [Candidatus Liptonbacteria bacterium]
MVRITKRGITRDVDEQLSIFVLGEIKKIKTKKELDILLGRLLTPEEQIMVKKRLAIRLFLGEGKRVRDIREALDVSKATICFVRRGLVNLPKKEKQIDITPRKTFRRPLKYKGWRGWSALDNP